VCEREFVRHKTDRGGFNLSIYNVGGGQSAHGARAFFIKQRLYWGVLSPFHAMYTANDGSQSRYVPVIHIQ
jgi:hypothetical protein